MLLGVIVEADIQLLSFASGALIPFLTAAITKQKASSRLKAVVTVVLSVAAGAVTYLLEHEGKADLQVMAIAVGTTFLTSNVSYESLWKKVGATQAVQQVTSDFGIGKPDQAKVAEEQKEKVLDAVVADVVIQELLNKPAMVIPSESTESSREPDFLSEVIKAPPPTAPYAPAPLAADIFSLSQALEYPDDFEEQWPKGTKPLIVSIAEGEVLAVNARGTVVVRSMVEPDTSDL